MSINAKKTQDMSIEEILKSIRGVISKHEDAQNNDEVLELTNVVDDNDDVANDYEHLISASTFQETAESLKSFADKAKHAVKNVQTHKALTIDKMVEQMMRPQLKEWLDNNLPNLVKELVEKEIKRLISHIDEEE
jgi:uncharacterized protein